MRVFGFDFNYSLLSSFFDDYTQSSAHSLLLSFVDDRATICGATLPLVAMPLVNHANVGTVAAQGNQHVRVADDLC